MKTIGERIRQARQAKGWSGEELAKRCGYKSQSGISNLENRATGSGGNKIARIAKELGVPLDWLINGSDSPDIPFTYVQYKAQEYVPLLRAEEERATYPVSRLPDPPTDRQAIELLELFAQLDPEGKSECLGILRGFVMGRRPHTHGQDPRLARQ